MCSSPKDRGVHKTHYKHQHSYNDVTLDKEHHYAEVANAAQKRREQMEELERRYKARHPSKKKQSFWSALMNLFRS